MRFSGLSIATIVHEAFHEELHRNARLLAGKTVHIESRPLMRPCQDKENDGSRKQ
ncbi:MAG: hypothetical protein JW884_07320 [Deltaproteobacteria bacterium]|nr:hypothetical protein [Deltaproteobacteria bacterium]